MTDEDAAVARLSAALGPATEPRDVDLKRIDHDLAELWREVIAARSIWAHSPGTDTIRAAEEAEERFNLLLDFRYRATHQTVTAG